ncbi:MAG: hypothetical protein RJQ07_03130 [Pseudomonadales bacterium]
MAQESTLGEVGYYALSAAQSQIANLLLGGLAVISLAFCVFTAIRERRAYPLYCFVGGSLAVYYELLTDILGRCVWATKGEVVISSAFGRDLPLYANFVYMFYFPVAAVLIHQAIRKGVTTRQWFNWMLFGIPLAFVFELYPVSQRWWYYYGEGQPLSILGLPMWWSFAATMAVTCSSALSLVVVDRFMQGRHSWSIMLVMPLSVVGLHMFVSFPVVTALSSSTSLLVTTPAALITMALSVAMLWAFGRVVCVDGGDHRS